MGLGASPFAAPAGNFPWSGAAVDLNFVTRRYWWNGAARLESDFASFTLNGATFTAQGLDFTTATSNPAISVSLATLGIAVPPICYAFAGYFVSAPAATKTLFQIDDATNNERFFLAASTSPRINTQTIDGGVSQSTVNAGAIQPGTSRFGICLSIQTNEVLSSGNGTAGAADASATMPTVTTLRIGADNTAGTYPPGVASRLIIFTAVKVQASVDALSIQVRDTP